MQLTVPYLRRSRYAPFFINYKHYLGFGKTPASASQEDGWLNCRAAPINR
jgi:hypothetical protein